MARPHGVGGRSEHDSTWYGLVVLLVPSLFLGISFVVLMGAVHRQAPAEGKIWSQTGLTFAIMYGTLICMNYFVQLTLVAPHLYRGNVTDYVRPFLFHVFNSFTYSVDLLGYSFISSCPRCSPRSSSGDRDWRRRRAGS